MKKIESLDLFRGFCGYGVAVCHFYAFLFKSATYEYISFLFVDMFFVLSGFVLYPQLTKIYNNKKNLKIFYMRRWLRTLPIFFIALITFSIVFQNFNYDTLKYLFFIQKIYPDFLTSDYMAIAWSLSIEEWFYLLFPIFLIFFNKLNIEKIFVYCLVVLYVFKVIFLLGDEDSNFYRTGTFLRLDAILFGTIVAHYYEIIKKFNLLTVFFLLFIYFYFKSFFISSTNFVQFIYVVLIQMISISFLIFFININKKISLKYFNKIYRLLANQTYSVYLFHFIFIYFIKIYNLENISLILLYYLFSLFISSSLIFSFFE